MLPPDDPHDRRADDDRSGEDGFDDPSGEDGFGEDGFEDEDRLGEDGFADDLPIVGALGGQTHNGQPIRGFNRGEPIPDLTRIPQEQWRAALSPVSRHTRLLSAAAPPSLEGARVANELVGDLMLSDAEWRARTAPPPSLPGGAPLARGASRQVGFRLAPEDHERLRRVARMYGMRPSALARVLTVRGVNLALHDERRGR
jgi:hypothetical protein